MPLPPDRPLDGDLEPVSVAVEVAALARVPGSWWAASKVNERVTLVFTPKTLPPPPLRGFRRPRRRQPSARQRPLAVARFEVDGADRVGATPWWRNPAARVERGLLDAVVGGQPHHDDPLDLPRAAGLEAGGLLSPVFGSRIVKPEYPSSPPSPFAPWRPPVPGRGSACSRAPHVPATQCTGHVPPSLAKCGVDSAGASPGCRRRVHRRRGRLGDLRVHRVDDLLAALDVQPAAGIGKVVLHVDDEQRRLAVVWHQPAAVPASRRTRPGRASAMSRPSRRICVPLTHVCSTPRLWAMSRSAPAGKVPHPFQALDADRVGVERDEIGERPRAARPGRGGGTRGRHDR